MSEYNPYYDNTYENNRQPQNYQRPLQIGAKNVLDPKQSVANQILNQIETKEQIKRREKQQQIEYERKINQQELIYLQKQPQQSYQPQTNMANQQPRYPKEESLSGGIFAGVFDKKESQKQQQQNEQKAYADEIQRQIEEKKRKKDEEHRRKQEEDLAYEMQVKRDMEELHKRFLAEEQQKNQIKSLQAKQQEQKQDSIHQVSKKKRNTEQFSKMLSDHDNPKQDDPPQDQTIPLGNITQQIIPPFLQDSVNDDNPQWRELNQQSRKSTNRQFNTYGGNVSYGRYPSQQPYDQQDQIFQNQNQIYPQPYQQQQQYQQQYSQTFQQPFQNQYQQQTFQPQPNKQQVNLDSYIRQYEEILAKNRQRQMEQDSEIKNLRKELDLHVNVLSDGLRALKVEEQLTQEKKHNAFQELEYLRDELARQEMKENRRLSVAKSALIQPRLNYPLQGSQFSNDNYRASNRQSDQLYPLSNENMFLDINQGLPHSIDGRLQQFEQERTLQANISML